MISLFYASLCYPNNDKDCDIAIENYSLLNESDSILISDFNDELSIWISYYHETINLSDFNLIKTEILPVIWSRVDKFDFDGDVYFPYYKFSPDKSKVLDLISYNLVVEKNDKQELISYGGSVDSEVSIKDIDNLIWKRILFLGSLYKIEDGFWIRDNLVAIVGQFDSKDYKSKPMIWLIDLKTDKCMTYEYKSYLDIKSDYQEKILYKDIKLMY